jgi:hypothetical protein
MAEKKVSKGNILSCVNDANKNPKLEAQIKAFIKNKGKGQTPKTLMDRFHRLGYEDVSLKDTRALLANIRGLQNPKDWDWHY